jgi:hypothetical protein
LSLAKVVQFEREKIGEELLMIFSFFVCIFNKCEEENCTLKKIKRKCPFMCRHTGKMYLRVVGDLLASAEYVLETLWQKPTGLL